jgi:hypothetical protein
MRTGAPPQDVLFLFHSFPELKTRMMPSEQDAYDELRCYTLAHRDPSFIHQHVVDAYTYSGSRDSVPSLAYLRQSGGLLYEKNGRYGEKRDDGAAEKAAPDAGFSDVSTRRRSLSGCRPGRL